MKTAESALTGMQKAAIILMQLEPEKAARVMQQFTEAEAEEVAAEIVSLQRVDPALAGEVINEFHEMTFHSSSNTRGGRDFALELLKASFGSEKAASVMSRLESSMAGTSFEFLAEADARQILILLDGELPQTIALVLGHVSAQKASAVLAGLGEPLGADVAQAFASMGTATPEAVGIVAETLRARANAVVSLPETVEVIGGVESLVEILNRADVATEKSLMEGLEERDPVLAEEIRSRMLTFADIVKLDRKDVQQVLRGIDAGVLALALKGAAVELVDVVHANITERNLEILQSESGATGPVRASQVEQARADIVRSIRELEAAGTITVRRNEEDDLVY
ncbi:flagellar motor switch protein FliG [Paenarthrobacter sp. PH39-S1]|uniref:flagellar motor switch protein FliG n=1 Tax=Paenarthrobacter sp. PH39-S1 TaxID=3046204 RepID=UPI0024BBB9C0|nr:flagellar motor switch protein FliG [Paenarthrobacter sp. PH39-S1]MDJ0355982.1 flagellar motor switch protein FliG [Paenarthrobacter sp. PH39-S1]